MTDSFSDFRWRGCDDKKFDNNFPADKQFLITERVPCQNRIADVESAAGAIQEIEMEDGWFEARLPEDAIGNEVGDMDNQMQVVGDSGTGGAAQQDDDEVADMDDDMADMDADMEQME